MYSFTCASTSCLTPASSKRRAEGGCDVLRGRLHPEAEQISCSLQEALVPTTRQVALPRSMSACLIVCDLKTDCETSQKLGGARVDRGRLPRFPCIEPWEEILMPESASMRRDE
ncbi:hypothetical protein G6O67_004426 [Ophiocordyceps sinensis]|uniref:Uncharacterized protein n=1 Tax=Ophiocordyceps sinensis TaxID=72228 RepID=A0A8H4LZ08_9HYPO|nr:hypothetical protein G6O67_004426 [Ophiocordyceps sinensis]